MKVIRAGLCTLMAFDVLSIGGVLPWAEAIVQLSAVGLFLFWGILAIRHQRADIHWNWLYLPLIGLCGVALIQYRFGLTASPYLTKLELLKWGTNFLLSFLTIESTRTVEEANRFAWFLILLGFFVSLFAIIQEFTSNEKVYWFMPLRQGGHPFGPYVNRDHFAGLVELTVPLGLALLFYGIWHREKLTVLVLLTIVPIGALTLSTSRAGIATVFIQSALLLLLWRAGPINRKQLLVDLALVILAGGFMVWLGITEVIQRFELLTPVQVSRNRRVSMYRDTWQIFIHHPWIGTGLGTLVVVYPHYESFYDGRIVDHAHNDYLELLADTGLVGGLFGLLLITVLFWRGLVELQSAEHRSTRALRAGALTGCTGLLLHGLLDFNLHIPANTLIFLLLASVATSELEETSHATFVS